MMRVKSPGPEGAAGPDPAWADVGGALGAGGRLRLEGNALHATSTDGVSRRLPFDRAPRLFPFEDF